MVDAMVAAQNPPASWDDDSQILPEKTFQQKRVDALLALAEQAMNTIQDGLQPLSSACAAMRTALVPQFAAAADDMASETLAIEREHEGIGLVIDSHTVVTLTGNKSLVNILAMGIPDNQPQKLVLPWH